ncbi:6-phosphogluconolactonase [Pararhodobacter sp. SW119]|uniref:6-phosphogluconolactonase n=1 Tax=Pararhodobacter sp. SW119 TaxID=2780075 RepID=UPI001ADFB189|nr:6-phosphogluconolactonase [Pararhodobacter sp. SW119]
MDLKEYADQEMMCLSLADRLASELRRALSRRERALFVVPGGTTPGPVFDILSDIDLDWASIDVLPSDERWVPEDDPRSNAGLLRRRLLQGRAAAARLIPLWLPDRTPEEALETLSETVGALLPIDVALLGMGADLHTASLFPGAEGLDAALASDAPPLMPIRAAAAPEPRMTLTLPVLKEAFAIHIVITGAEKRAALERAEDLDPAEAPVAALLGEAQIHWAE